AVQAEAVTAEAPARAAALLKMELRSVAIFYRALPAVIDVNMPVPERKNIAIIGPSGCGKSTLLRALNRMNDLVPGARVEGEVLLDGQSIYAPRSHLVELGGRG